MTGERSEPGTITADDGTGQARTACRMTGNQWKREPCPLMVAPEPEPITGRRLDMMTKPETDTGRRRTDRASFAVDGWFADGNGHRNRRQMDRNTSRTNTGGKHGKNHNHTGAEAIRTRTEAGGHQDRERVYQNH